MSCSYDKTVVVWKYQHRQIVERIEKQEELRCMDYLSSTKTLFVGTNQKSILTINIEMFLDPLIRQVDFSRRRGLPLYGLGEDEATDGYKYSEEDELNI